MGINDVLATDWLDIRAQHFATSMTRFALKIDTLSKSF
jgi:hypothetical protein